MNYKNKKFKYSSVKIGFDDLMNYLKNSEEQEEIYISSLINEVHFIKVKIPYVNGILSLSEKKYLIDKKEYYNVDQFIESLRVLQVPDLDANVTVLEHAYGNDPKILANQITGAHNKLFDLSEDAVELNTIKLGKLKKTLNHGSIKIEMYNRKKDVLWLLTIK